MSLSENRRGLAQFAQSSEQIVPDPLPKGGSGIGSKVGGRSWRSRPNPRSWMLDAPFCSSHKNKPWGVPRRSGPLEGPHFVTTPFVLLYTNRSGRRRQGGFSVNKSLWGGLAVLSERTALAHLGGSAADRPSPGRDPRPRDYEKRAAPGKQRKSGVA
jgi:hypothetical protein